MQWTAQQDAAMRAVRRWLKDRNGPQVFRLFGYAGVGKTTLARHLAQDVRGEVVYMAFTGKASLVLRKKGCEGARTIHSAIYKPSRDPVTNEMTFQLNPDSDVADAALIVVDEVSQVNGELGTDLLSFGVKVLVLGDPFQLPPVTGEGFFINAQPDFMLDEVLRQAADNPIIRMSMDIREGRALAEGMYGESRVIRRRSVSKEEMGAMVLAADQALCGRNATRQTFNLRIRALRGLASEESAFAPTVGDRLVCLKNKRDMGLFNGGLWDVTRMLPRRRKLPNSFAMEVKSVDEPHRDRLEVVVPGQFFMDTQEGIDWAAMRKQQAFTFGNCLTVHKGQGSQWDNVLLYDESFCFGEHRSKHIYTGITRAAERVTVFI